MTMLAQYQRMLETLLGCFLYSVRFMTESKTSPGSGRAPLRKTVVFTDLAYGLPAAPSWGNIIF